MKNNSDDYTESTLNPAFLEEMISFARDVRPMINSAQAQLGDSIKSFPELLIVIREIESQIKRASSEIMDKIDDISMITKRIPEKFSRLSVNYDNLLPGAISLLETFKKKDPSDLDYNEFISKIDILLESFKIQAQIRFKDKEIIAHIEETISQTHSDTTSIMVSLQYQDIVLNYLISLKSRIQEMENRLQEIDTVLGKSSVSLMLEEAT